MARGQWGGSFETQPFRVTVSYRVGTSQHQVGFHLRNSVVGFADAQDVADNVGEWATTNFRTILRTTDELLGVDVVNRVTAEGGAVSFSNQPGTQTSTGEALPSFLAVVATLKGELRTRYGQGRMFMPVRSESLSDGDQLVAGGTAAIQGVLNALVTRYVGSEVMNHLQLINVHGVLPPKAATESRPARPEIPASWYDVTTIRLNNVVTALRSRMVNHGS